MSLNTLPNTAIHLEYILSLPIKYYFRIHDYYMVKMCVGMTVHPCCMMCVAC